ncbi:hypothetical protein P12x_000192 [Tundrisphaera lichenicola]|uniref:hypothetical protein n=1 Tax=Tundrisphaera lichenicola TaxID=2029860 RepID=UPI003EC01C56
MKRTFAVVILLASLGVLLKLALREGQPQALDPVESAGGSSGAPAVDPEVELVSRYPAEAELVRRVYREYRQNALAIERSDGLRGLKLLDALGVEAVYLFESHPSDFAQLRETLTDASAAEILLHWREYFGLKRADDTDRKLVIAEIGRLSPSQRRVAARFPNALALVLADPSGVTELVDRWSGDPADLTDALALLSFISLEPGAADLRLAIRTLDDHGPLALEAFRVQGLDGFALVRLYGPVLGAIGRALPLDQALILLRVNSSYVDELLRTHQPEMVAAQIRHVAASGLVEEVGGSPDALRLFVEFGERGERALSQAGPDAADVVFEDFAEATLRNQAVEALADHGTMALAILDKYAADPDFREILRTSGPDVIPPIARADAGPEALALLKTKPRWSWSERLAHSVLALSGDNGQATIRLIKDDGLGRVAELESSEVGFQQFLPLYDLLHLANVARRGQSPTSGEVAWAGIDACFVILDALSLVAVQPEGVVASEAARAEVRTAARQALESAGREAVEGATADVTQAAARRGLAGSLDAATDSARLARWWTVRAAGGTYSVFRRLPEALPKLTVSEIADLGRNLCGKAGLSLSTWAPIRLLKDGQEVLLRIPPEKGLKYLGVQVAQASVGVVGFHKLEEHLASRRAPSPHP